MPPEGLTGKTANGETLRVREVWEDNLADEIALIRNIVEEYPYVAMDTEFPGVVARPVGHFKSNREYHYRVSHPAAAAAAAVAFKQPVAPDAECYVQLLRRLVVMGCVESGWTACPDR
jgi:hypothetical protein